MKLNYKNGAIAFLLVSCFLAFMWWLGGFDFNKRGEQVAVGFLMSAAVSIVIAAFFAVEE